MPYRSRDPQHEHELRERPWVFFGAASLAAVAGYVNVVVLGVFHVPVSHMSGAASRLSIDVAARDLGDVRLVLSILVGFLLGATLSGLVIGGRKLVPGRRYGVALLLEGALLAGATGLLAGGRASGVPLAAMACGVQNAMASSYYGLVIRTTHVTGIVTDVGVMLGHWIRHGRIRTWKLMLLVCILAGFLGGGLLGAVAAARIGVHALALASAACLVGGLVYYGWWHVRRRADRRADRHTP